MTQSSDAPHGRSKSSARISGVRPAPTFTVLPHRIGTTRRISPRSPASVVGRIAEASAWNLSPPSPTRGTKCPSWDVLVEVIARVDPPRHVRRPRIGRGLDQTEGPKRPLEVNTPWCLTRDRQHSFVQRGVMPAAQEDQIRQPMRAAGGLRDDVVYLQVARGSAAGNAASVMVAREHLLPHARRDTCRHPFGMRRIEVAETPCVARDAIRSLGSYVEVPTAPLTCVRLQSGHCV